MPSSADEVSWPTAIHLDGETPNAQSPGLPHLIWQVQASNSTVVAVGDGNRPYLLVTPFGKGYFIYDASMQPLIGHGGWAPGIYAYSIFRKAIEWAFQSANLPVVKNSPWPYPYDAAVIFRHDMEAIPVNITGIESSAQFEHANGASGDYYFCTGTLRLDMPNPTYTNTIASLKRAITNYGATISPHNGGLTNINPVYIPTLVPIEPNLTYLISNGWYTIFEPYGSPQLAPPLNTNGTDYDYWHWSPDDILDLTNPAYLPAGFTNGTQYAYASLSNSFADIQGWGLTNGTPRQWVAPYFNATREGSYKIEEQLGIKITGDTKLGPFPHWTVSTETPDKYYSLLQIPVSDWFLSSQFGTQIAQSMENGHTSSSIHALVDFYYNMGALINLYCHSTSDGLGMDGPLPGDYVTYSLSKPRVWSTNAVGIYAWWLQRSNSQVTATFTNVNGQSITTLSIKGESNTNAAVQLMIPSSVYAGLQVYTNSVLAGASMYRTNGQILTVRVGTTVSNVVVNYAVPPAAQDDFFTAKQATPLVVSAPGVLANDNASGGGGLTAALVSGPANGGLVLNTNGSFTYTPTSGFTGVDGFLYQTISGSLTSSVAVASISVASSNELFYDNFSRPANTNSIFPWVAESGNWNISNNQMVATSPLGSYGYAYYNGNWTNFSVQAQIQFSSTNGWGGGIGARMNPGTGAHYAVWILPEFSPGGPKNGTPVLQLLKYENWFDYTVIADQVPLPPVGTSQHTVGLTCSGNTISAFFDGVLITNATDNGLIDGQAAYTSGAISLNMWTEPPVASSMTVDNVIVSNLGATANNDAYGVTENATRHVPAPGVLANDLGGNSTLTAVLPSTPAHGSLTLTNNGGFTYTPTANFTGVDSFTYRATDGQTTSGVATVTLTVSDPLVDPPTATNDIYVTSPGPLLNVTAPGVLTNDAGSGSLSAILVSSPAHGTFSWGGDGSFSYQSTNGFAGVDDFTYQVTDGSTTSGVAVVAIEVIPEGKLFLDNFTHSPLWPWIQQTGTWSIANNALSGVSPNDSYGHAYLSNNWSDYLVQAQIKFSSTNAWGGGIGGRMEPVTGAHYGAWVYPEAFGGGVTNGAAVMKVIKFHSWNGSDYTTVAQVILTNLVGTNWHTVGLAFQGSNIFAYYDGNQVTNLTDDGTLDGQAAFTSGGICADMYTVTNQPYILSFSNVMVTPLVTTPVANNDSYTMLQNTTLNVSAPGILNNDTGSGSLTALLASGPLHGTLTLTNNGGFRYTPTNSFFGTDSFTYRATDGSATSSVATVTVNITNAAPGAVNDIYVTSPGPLLNVTAPGVLTNDAGSGSLSAILVSSPAHGTFSWGGDGSFSYQSTNGFAGVDDFTYQVTDGSTTSGVAVVAIEVVPEGKLFLDNFTHSPLWPWIQQTGTWSIANNVLSGVSPNDSYGHAYLSNNWSDYLVQAQIKFSSTNAWGGGIGGRMEPVTGAHYGAWVYPEAFGGGVTNGAAVMKVIKFHSWNGSDYTTVAQVILTNLVGTNWHTVGLAFQGSNIFAYYDGNQVTNLTDDGTLDGQAAFTSGGICADMYTVSGFPYTLSFSNVVVTPLVANDSYTVNGNATLNVPAPGVLANDTNIYGTLLTATLVSGASHGILSFTNNGGFSYTPTNNFSGH